MKLVDLIDLALDGASQGDPELKDARLEELLALKAACQSWEDSTDLNLTTLRILCDLPHGALSATVLLEKFKRGAWDYDALLGASC